MSTTLQVYLILAAMGIFGAIVVLPYAFAVNGDKMKDLPLTRTQLMIVSAIQSAIFVLIAAGLGLLMAGEVGLGAPIIEGLVNGEPLPAEFGTWVLLAIVSGALVSAGMVLIDRFIFMPRLPEAFRQITKSIALWKRFIAGFYGGITEEILTRLFMMTLIVWLLGKVGMTSDTAYWIGIFGAALIFGALHLPATRALAPLTPFIVVRGLLLNALFAILAGWLYWQYGLMIAMIAHFTADMVLHVVTPFFARPDDAPAVNPSTPLTDAVNG